jgi:hypothetical protein
LIGSEADVDDEVACRWVMHFIQNGVAAGPMAEVTSNLSSRPAATPAHTKKIKRPRR